jgi:hypothetical protein
VSLTAPTGSACEHAGVELTDEQAAALRAVSTSQDVSGAVATRARTSHCCPSNSASPGNAPRLHAARHYQPVRGARRGHRNRHRGLLPPANRAEFLAFLCRAVKPHEGKEIHVVLDNLSTHDTPAVRAWLDANPNVTVHFTRSGRAG